MTPTLIVLALLVLGVAIVVWATRGKRSSAANSGGPDEADTAWNDPITPPEPAHRRDEPAPPPSSETRP